MKFYILMKGIRKVMIYVLVGFKDKQWLLLFLVDFVLPFGCSSVETERAYLLITLRRSSQYRTYRNSK